MDKDANNNELPVPAPRHDWSYVPLPVMFPVRRDGGDNDNNDNDSSSMRFESVHPNPVFPFSPLVFEVFDGVDFPFPQQRVDSVSVRLPEHVPRADEPKLTAGARPVRLVWGMKLLPVMFPVKKVRGLIIKPPELIDIADDDDSEDAPTKTTEMIDLTNEPDEAST